MLKFELTRTISAVGNEDDGVNRVAFSSEERMVVAGSELGAMMVYDLESGKCLARTDANMYVWDFSVVPKSSDVVVTHEDGFTLLDLQTLRVKRKYEAGGGSLTLSPTGQTAFMLKDNILTEVGLGIVSSCRSFDSSDSSPYGMLALDSQRLVTTGFKELLIWDLKPEQPELSRLAAHENFIYGLAALGNRLVTCSNDKTIAVWDLATRQRMAELTDHEGVVYKVSIAKTCPRMASCSGDMTIRVWNLDDYRCEAVLTGHTIEPEGVAISADGTRVITGSYDQTIQVWDLKMPMMGF